MSDFHRLFLLISVLAIFASCASGYTSIQPKQLVYVESRHDSLFAYKEGVLHAARNKKYVNKEIKRNLEVIAVRITNTTDHPIRYNSNYAIYSGDAAVVLLPPENAGRQIKQNAGLYLLYLLLTPMQLDFSSPNSQSSFPAGLAAGPAIAGSNTAIAASANKKFRQELALYDITKKEIQPGETVFGLITIKKGYRDPLTLRLTATP